MHVCHLFSVRVSALVIITELISGSCKVCQFEVVRGDFIYVEELKGLVRGYQFLVVPGSFGTNILIGAYTNLFNISDRSV